MRIIECEQGTLEWVEARRGIPSASNGNKILQPSTMTVSKQREAYLYDLCEERFGVIRTSFTSQDMQNGIEREAEARNYYSFLNSYSDVVTVGFCLDESGRYGASPDFLIGDDGGGEIKSPRLITHSKYVSGKVLPLEYKLQVLWSLLVTEREYWMFHSYFHGGKPFSVEVLAKDYESEINTLRIAVEQFCDDLDKLEQKERAA